LTQLAKMEESIYNEPNPLNKTNFQIHRYHYMSMTAIEYRCI